MTLAPELPGADALIRRLRERGVVVSAGHTNATAEEASRGFDLGITGLTHVFNAMRPLLSRDPGVAGVALTRPDVVVKMIVDGHHLARETVQLVWACAAGRVALITDAMAGAGAGGGTFRFGEVEVEVEAGAAPMLEDGTLAGSVLTMIDAVRNLHALGVPLRAGRRRGDGGSGALSRTRRHRRARAGRSRRHRRAGRPTRDSDRPLRGYRQRRGQRLRPLAQPLPMPSPRWFLS